MPNDATPRTILALTFITLLAGCQVRAESDPPRYADAAYGYSIAVPADAVLSHAFTTGYFGNGSWKIDAEADTPGTPRLSLTLTDSNRITTAEMRIGVSENAAAVRSCNLPPAAVSAPPQQVILGGVEAVHFHGQDAGMNHYRRLEAYRIVRNGRCYAIDLLVYGTNPQVYDPPATPPFSRAHAEKRLYAWLKGFRFDR